MKDQKSNKKLKKKVKISIKNFDKYSKECTIENIQILGKELRVYAQSPDIIKKNRELLKDLIQLLFKYLMNGEEEVIGYFKDEDIFIGIRDIYFYEDYQINCNIIQNLSMIIINNEKSKSFLYFILSNNFINDLLLIDYSKYDDEFYSYFVNFIKS